jgi:hypothetical protein
MQFSRSETLVTSVTRTGVHFCRGLTCLNYRDIWRPQTGATVTNMCQIVTFYVLGDEDYQDLAFKDSLL